MYIPRAAESQFAGSRKSMERIAKEGRKYGVGLVVVSQRPHEVSETVLAQCGTFICLRITNPDDQDYVRSLVPESAGNLVSVLAGLGRGEALVLGEAVPVPTRVQFDRPNPAPNSDDTDFYAKWKDGPADLDVDEIVKLAKSGTVGEVQLLSDCTAAAWKLYLPAEAGAGLPGGPPGCNDSSLEST